MLDGLKRAIQRRILQWAVERASKRLTPPELSFTDVWDDVHRVLILWPGSALDVLAARLIFNRLRERFPDASLTVLALPGVGASPPPEVEAEVISLSNFEMSSFGVPTQQFRRRLQDLGFDAVVDLSPTFEPLAALLVLATGSKVRIGFAGQKGDLAYNYQVAPRSDRAGIDRYRVMARYIG